PDTRLERDVAVKVLPAQLTDSQQARDRFKREARAVAALPHPNICTIHDVGETADGRAFLVMELLPGETLQQRLARGPMAIASVVDAGIALAGALAAAHAAGIVHRDIKPANIFLTPHGPKLLDFGLAKADVHPVAAASGQLTATGNPLLTGSGSIVGTVAYMSPEQLRGEPLDARTDLFSLGLALYEAATGRPAFAGSTGAVIAAAILESQPAAPRVVRTDLPEALDRVILKAIEKDRVLRYQHASEIRADLLRLERDGDAPRSRRGRTLTAVALAAIAIGVAVIGGTYAYFHRPPRLTDRDTIVLADFRNATGDAVFDETLRRGLAVQLEQSPFLSLVTDEKIRKTLALMGRPADARLTSDVAREVCQRTGSAAVLEGSIAMLGSQYVLGLRAANCHTGDVLDEEQVQAARKEEVLNALSDIAKTFRTRVGESLATVEKHSTRLEEATTSSLEALKAFSAGWKVNVSSGPTAALPLFKRAADMDPQFAMAFANIGIAYSGVGEAALSAESTRRAYTLRDRVSDPERFFIATMYDRQVTGNLERELQTLLLWAQTYPRDAHAHSLIAGFATHGTGRYELCLDEATRAKALDPDLIFSYESLVTCNLQLERRDQAEREWEKAIGLHFTEGQMPELGYFVAFLKGDRGGMDRQAAAVRGAAGGEERMALIEALALARTGQLTAAAGASRRAVDIAERVGHREGAATYEAGVADWSALFGDAAAARQHAGAALRTSKGRDVEYAAAFALALAGSVSEAQPLAADLEQRYPEDTSVQTSYLPALRALFALHAGQPARAIEQLQPALAHEFADPAISFLTYFGSLYPVYVRGEAYLAAHDAPAAAAEFQKIVDHRGLVLVDPLDARARLELGRAWAAAGSTAKAKAAYTDFLALWKGADADVPILKDARAEDGRLQ
ncbi:MAG TPA: serine/threonine-protein kinase, partial [Vicinamibacterales bacterium]|nr:serine/threonine-protein kinase [Vicinamibacterales bacterium]